MTTTAYEKLGMFYLGKEVDVTSGEKDAAPFLYKNKSLTTHAAIIGMTGSGKTGLGVAIIEEAMMDNIPSIIIDPKGDMGNLLLTFPELRAQDFSPWLDPAEAARKGLDLSSYAEKTASTWKDGLQSWEQDSARIAELKSKSECTIYTPGSSAGVPISVLNSFDAPGDSVLQDTDTLNSMVNGAVTSLLALAGVKASSTKSREHILLSSILLHFWRKGESLDLEMLISNVVNPPFKKIGVFGLDTFFKQADRMELAMSLNNILASPTFSAWTSGPSLDIQRILYGTDGKPRTAIFSIAHLSETERMFFVTILLNQFVAWMRRQQGASTLKALLYMDEIFGYFPPTANPPSKKPMLLLLKQARAFGVGVVLATQNPVDLDYKGLSNIGTWFVGKLQTSQDQARVTDGIVGASDGLLDRKKVKELLGDMKGRQFLLNSVHLNEPLLFETRWVMSYLKGPMSLVDVGKLMEGRYVEKVSTTENLAGSSSETGAVSDSPPILSDGIEQQFLLSPVLTDTICFEPWLVGTSSVRFYNQKRNIDEVKEVSCRLYLDEDISSKGWSEAEEWDSEMDECVKRAPDKANFYTLPEAVSTVKNFGSHQKEFMDYLYNHERLELFKVGSLKLESDPGEELGDFTVRLSDHLKEKKEEAVEKLQKKYEVKTERIEKQIQRGTDKIEKEQDDVSAKKTDTLISVGQAILGAFLERKVLSSGSLSRAATGIRKVGRISKEKDDVRRAQEQVARLQEDLVDLGEELEDEITTLSDSFSPDNYEVDTFAIKPRRSDIFDSRVCLLWEMVSPVQKR